MSEHTAATGLALIVPCHDESPVIERRLANLLACDWPAGPARVVVVDDHSTDGTAARVRAWLDARAASRVRVDVLESERAPGKTSALAVGLAWIDALESAERPALVGMTDADVVLTPSALVRAAAAFEDARIGLVCGEQRFVEALPGDGTAPPHDAPSRGGRYDHLTARVRRFESRFGRLFSVHGQLAVWRRSLDLAPTIGVAADDVDLMTQVRTAGRRTVLVSGATFFETKPALPDDRTGQAERRARAWFDAVDAATDRARATGAPSPLGPTLLDRVQWSAYAGLPLVCAHLAAPLAAAVLVSGVAAVWRLVGAAPALVLLAASAAGLVLARGPVRDWLTLARIIRCARRDSRRTLEGADRWEMARR